jgi:tRNA(Leu) C34 or U34 (ribose-2'-O)-methylase TrmL
MECDPPSTLWPIRHPPRLARLAARLSWRLYVTAPLANIPSLLGEIDGRAEAPQQRQGSRRQPRAGSRSEARPRTRRGGWRGPRPCSLHGAGRCASVLEDAHDPHNVSAVLRTCEAFGIQDVHLVVEEPARRDPQSKVTIGAHRWLTLHRHRGSARRDRSIARGWLPALREPSRCGATPLPQIDAHERAAYVFGNERSGVTARWIEAADATFVLPTSGFSGSPISRWRSP